MTAPRSRPPTAPTWSRRRYGSFDLSPSASEAAHSLQLRQRSIAVQHEFAYEQIVRHRSSRRGRSDIQPAFGGPGGGPGGPPGGGPGGGGPPGGGLGPGGLSGRMAGLRDSTRRRRAAIPSRSPPWRATSSTPSTWRSRSACSQSPIFGKSTRARGRLLLLSGSESNHRPATDVQLLKLEIGPGAPRTGPPLVSENLGQSSRAPKPHPPAIPTSALNCQHLITVTLLMTACF